MRFAQVINALFSWLCIHNLRRDSLTVIVNFSDPVDAAEFEMALRRELTPGLTGSGDADVTAFEMFGINVRVESPIHAEPRLK